ncbi:MAG: sigma-70 family RNA polymerase sigma factor [Verrucomicrobia bacterium]|nr:sigma-70 family RNA polymerase sigma factor [Verrucomicrobiota bacterium]MBV9656718.1 sigma-70 family RNA polymerase sigma factor [Verrucomicrobiota bacterium]
MDAAYNLARWLTHNDHDARDAVQDAYLRAWKFFQSFRGGDSRVWLLAIVRNTCFSWLKKQRAHEPATPFDEEIHSGETAAPSPAELLARGADGELLRAALAELPAEFREALVLRELEELSYKEIADVAGIPLGTVMSRLARGRQLLAAIVVRRRQEEESP